MGWLWQRWTMCLLWFSLGFLVAGCPAPPASVPPGKLATDLKENRLDFDPSAGFAAQSADFLLYNGGGQDLTVTGFAIVDDADISLRVENPPPLPFLLRPGQTFGKVIFLKFQAKRFGSSCARLRLFSPDADNVNTESEYFVRFCYALEAPKLAWECGGELDFGAVEVGKTLYKRCLLRNRGTMPLTVLNASLAKETGGKAQDFRLVSPSLPAELTPGEAQGLDVEIAYTPSDTTPTNDISQLILSVGTKSMVPLEALLEALRLKGSGFAGPPQPRCRIQVEPRKLTFSGPDSKQVTISNRGDKLCLLHQVFLDSGKTDPFQLLPAIKPGQVIASNGSLSFLVKYSPTEQARETDTLKINSDDPDEPLISVAIEGGVVGSPPCELDAFPLTLNFGFVAVGRSHKMNITIANKGFGDCEITQLNVIGTNPSANTAFQMVSTPSLPLRLRGGTNLRLEVSYTPPAERSGYEARLEIQSNDKKSPNYEVKLVGASGTLCLEALPSSLDFGATKFGCATTSRSIEVFHLGNAKCPTNIDVTGIQLANNPNGEFRIKSAPVAPVTLALGQSIKVDLSHKAKDIGVDTATLEILNSVPGQSPLVLPLLGEGLNESTQKDVFTQARRPQADIMFIIDNSSSIGDDQANLVANLKSMFAWLLQVGVDYQVMVTTTDVTGVGGGAGCAQGAVKIVTPSTPDPEATLRANALVGTHGSASEQGLEAAYRALRPPTITTCNRGFLRPSAALSLVFVSDEEDQSPQSVAFYLAFFRSLKGIHRTDLLRASAIVGPPPMGCHDPGKVSAGAGARYWDVAKELNGVQASLCLADWASILSQVSAVGGAFKRQFFLSRVADAATIVVKVNQQVVTEDAQNGWQYDATSNSVTFASSAVPGGSAVIEVQYQAMCLP